VNEFFAERVFSPQRIALMRHQLPQQTSQDDDRANRLRKELRDLGRRQDNVLTQIEEYEPTGDDEIDRDFRERLQRRFADLARTRKAKAEELKSLAANTQPKEDTSLLCELPRLAANLATSGRTFNASSSRPTTSNCATARTPTKS
jgi:hypothetical protein